MRILGFMFLVMLVIPNLTMKRRLPAQKPGSKTAWDHRILSKNPVLSLYMVAGFLAFLGFYVVIIFIDIAAISHGVDAKFSFYLVRHSSTSVVLILCEAGLNSEWCFGTRSIERRPNVGPHR